MNRTVDRAGACDADGALPPWCAPRIDALQARLSRQVCRGARLPLPELGSQATLELQGPVPGPMPTVSEDAIELRSPAGHLVVPDGGRSWIHALTGVRLAATRDAVGSWLEASAVALLPAVLARRFAALCSPSASDGPPQPDGVGLQMTLRTPDHVLTTPGWAPATLWLALLADGHGTADAASRAAWGALPSRWPIVVARHALAAEQLRHLATGDLVLPQQAMFDCRGRGRWQLGRHGWHVRFVEPRLEIMDMADHDAAWSDPQTAAPDAEAPAGNDPGPAQPEDLLAPQPCAPGSPEADAAPPALALDALTVTLEFSLGSVTASIAELAELAPGAVLVPSRPAGRGQVWVLVDGRPVGLGELVDVEGQLGVRLVQWSAR